MSVYMAVGIVQLSPNWNYVLQEHTNQLAGVGDSVCRERIEHLATNMLMTDFSVKRSFLADFGV